MTGCPAASAASRATLPALCPWRTISSRSGHFCSSSKRFPRSRQFQPAGRFAARPRIPRAPERYRDPGGATMPEAPGTLEGWYCQHDFRRLDWPRWKALPPAEREAVAAEAAAFLEDTEAHRDASEGSSALFEVVGHKADLMLLHLRPTVDDLAALERRFAATRLADFTSQPYSYVS